jgi:3-oxoacyl-[acyl-carrier-protein] synthase II
MTRREVVVTGIGCLGPWGIGMPALAAALQRGAALGTPIDRSAGYHRGNAATRVAACGPLDLTPWLSPQAARRMSDMSQYAVAAGRMALADAGLADVRGERTAVALATAFGPGGFTEQLARQILEKGGKAASPFLFTDCVANAAAGQIAIDLGARGPNTTICQREAGPLLALAQGAADIALGRADICLAGSVDEMRPLSHAILDRFRALARPGRDSELPRPFDRRRSGMLAGEGATVLVLEAEATAHARGARVLARVGATARAFDPSAGRASFGRDADGLAAVLQERLAPALSEVSAIVSTASGARRGDALEAAVLRRTFAELPPVLVPKAVHGEYGGGTLATALLALAGGEFARPVGCTEPDPELGITPAQGRVQASRVLCTALAAGGTAAWTVLEVP